uniref:Uncharacterized protein n=1 Tax=Rhizophagus irregularis (strain DAOM 181602 / DAOM 197198 / MUCL 43194) TaxID=747089 RepID=U9UQA7_RHIID
MSNLHNISITFPQKLETSLKSGIHHGKLDDSATPCMSPLRKSVFANVENPEFF